MKRHNRSLPARKYFLQDLILLRNDPDLLPEVMALAEEGDINAQYALGLIYAEGRGTAVDLVQSYVWLSRAITLGDTDAQQLRNVVIEQMSESDMQRAEWMLCNGCRLH